MLNQFRRTSIGIVGLGIIWLFTSILTGCGYRFSGAGNLPGNVESVHVPLFESHVSEAALEIRFTSDLVDELIQNGRSVKKSEAGAEGVIRGSIRSLTTADVTRRKSESINKKEMIVVVDVYMLSRQGKRVWGASGITEQVTYDVQSGADDSLNAMRKEAILRISKRIAERIYSRMTDQF